MAELKTDFMESDDSFKEVVFCTRAKDIRVGDPEDRHKEQPMEGKTQLPPPRGLRTATEITPMPLPLPDPPDENEPPDLVPDEKERQSATVANARSGTKSEAPSTPPFLEDGFSQAFNRVFIKEEISSVEDSMDRGRERDRLYSEKIPFGD